MINKSGIYSIRFGNCERIYIGSSMKLNRRKSQHLYCLRRNTHQNPKLQAYFNKYGEELFNFNVLELVDGDFEQLCKKEQEYLDKYYAQEYIKEEDNRFDKLLLNVTPEVGLMRVHWTKERRQNLVKRNKSFEWTEERRKEMSKRKRGKKKTKEQKESQMRGIDAYWKSKRKSNSPCPHCESTHVRKIGQRKNKTKNIVMHRHRCMNCRKSYSIPV